MKTVESIFLTGLVSLLGTILLTSSGPDTKARCWTREENSITIDAAQLKVRITPYSEDIIRVEKYPAASAPKADDGMCVTMIPRKTRFSVKSIDGSVVLSTPSLKVSVSLGSATVSFDRPDGVHLINEQPLTYSAVRPSQTFALSQDEAIYGLGQHREGGLNLRGEKYHLINENMEIAIPLVHSSNGYALLWNNGSITDFSDSASGMQFVSESGSGADYFFVWGKNADGVVSGLRRLSGKVPMFPLWSLGFAQSRERYTSQDEIVGVVKWFRDNNVPLDCIVQDWQYWGEDFRHWNAVEFGNPKYPQPQKMLRDIHGMNARCMISVWPSFGPQTDIYKELEKNGCLMPHATFPQQAKVRNYDAFNPLAREILWSRMRDNIYSLGMDAWWLDATEPEHSPVTREDLDFVTAAGPFRDVRNLYPLASVGGLYRLQKQFDPSRRVFILTRSAALGMQQYAHCWSGDVECSWHTLSQQIRSALNFSLCSLPYWNSDIGGFYTRMNYPEGVRDEAYRNIYLRWMQFAVFTGLMRSHGTNTPREIFNFGKRGDFHFDAQEKAIRLRYRLMPYIYSLMHEISREDGTLMRALVMDWPDDPLSRECGDEFLFGRSILVAPVVSEGTSRRVYLPEDKWIDARTGAPVSPGSFTADVPMDEIALYVRGGSIIPIGPDVNYTGEKSWEELTVLLYPGKDGSFTLYEDEGDGYGYQDGAFSTITFKWNDKSGTLEIGKRKGEFPGMLPSRKFRIVPVNSTDLSSALSQDGGITVDYDGKMIKKSLKF